MTRQGSSHESPPGIVNRVTFLLFWLSFGALLRVYFRLRSRNRPKLKGAYVLAPNHTSYLDPILLGAVSWRRITFMMTGLLYRGPRLGWFYRWTAAIPVEARGGNRAGLRAARDVLRSGRVLSVFPEGGIGRDGRLLLGNPGVVSLVLNEGVPVVPVGIVGSHRAFPSGGGFPKPHRIEIRFGDPIPAEELRPPGRDRKQTLILATQRIMREIAVLTDQTAREDELLRFREQRASDA